MTQRTILYVEDNEYNRKIVRQLLARSDAGCSRPRTAIPAWRWRGRNCPI